MNHGTDRMKVMFWRFRTTVMLGLGLAWSSVALCAPIHVATIKGDEAKVVVLLKQNPDLVDSRDKFGNTALHLAALHNKVAIADLLLDNGADVNARNTDATRVPRIEGAGETPLTLALLSYEHKEMVELLLTHGADANVMLSHGDTPLHRAVERDLPYDVELLLANGADPNARGFNWQSPVHMAVWHGRTGILEVLLNYGADPNAKDLGGHTPLFYAQASSDEKAIGLLRAHGGHM
jgi:ankyrin repeat protein